MLVELSIKDFAIIENLRVSFGPGLNIFTGETGAGKSIIMDAISLILGDRASNGLIRDGRDEAHVEALFDVSGCKGIEGVLKEAGIEHSENLVIKRVVQRAGRNRVYINGNLATLVTLTEVGRRLIDIYGQSEHQSLTRPEEHIEILDSFGGFQNLRNYMSNACRAYGSLKKEYEGLIQEAKTSSERRDLLEFQLNEITGASLMPGEDVDLKALHEKLKNAEKIKSVTAGAERAVYSDAGSVIERLGVVLKALKDISVFDPKISKPCEAIESSLYQIEDAAGFLRDYSESIDADPDVLERVDSRLDLINRLKKKYGGLDEILARKLSLEKELSGIAGFEDRIKGLEAGVKEAMEKASLAASNLADARGAAAKELEKRMEDELSTLGMKGAVFEVAMDTERNPDGSVRFNEKGSERVSFFISTNPGEGIKPLARIASGGELSRIMLAMKNITAVGRVPTLIFDEIDAGVGGAMAQVVGLKIKEVSKIDQVLCITHLPQIAAFADKHFLVAKKGASGGRTVTSVEELSGDGKIEHISTMLAGMKVTDTTRKSARELLKAASDMTAKKTVSKKK